MVVVLIFFAKFYFYVSYGPGRMFIDDRVHTVLFLVAAYLSIFSLDIFSRQSRVYFLCAC